MYIYFEQYYNYRELDFDVQKNTKYSTYINKFSKS